MQTISLRVRLVVLVVTASATLAVANLANQVQWYEWPRLVLFFFLIVLSSSVRISDPRGRSVTPSTVLTYLAIYVFNAPTVLLVIGVGRAIGYALSRGWVPWRALANGSQAGLSAALGAVVFRFLGGGLAEPAGLATYAAALAGALTHQAANNFFVALVVSQWRGTPFINTWLSGIRELLWPNLLSIPSAYVLAILYSGLHFTVVLAYLALLPFQWRALRLYVRRRQLYEQIVDGLVVATDANFPLGKGHARRVTDLAVAIARELRLSEATIEVVQFAALLHDVGMIGKDDVLDRAVLTDEDVDALKDHVKVGAEIAREMPRKEIAEAVLRHHERYDGTGYPDGLIGEAIPLPARIVALAEAIDSMSSGTYPYAAPAPYESIVDHLATERGNGFDPEVVDAFLRSVQQDSARSGTLSAPFGAQRSASLRGVPG